MKNSILILFFCSFSVLYSQKKLRKEFSFQTDNDYYISISKDRYYTNGIFLTYRYLSKNTTKKLEKKILEWKIGHQMFTPYKVEVTDVSMHDRPFASYLYGSFGIHRIYPNNQIFITSLQLGMIGPAAFGKELQDAIHTIRGFVKAEGWKHQIKNAFGLNLQASYQKLIVTDPSNHFDLTWNNSAKVGTVFTNISSGFLGRMSFYPLQEMMNSIAFNTSINDHFSKYHNEQEVFFYLKTHFNYTLYDATIQGSFLNTGSEVTKKLIREYMSLEFGLRFSIHRFNFGYAYHLNGRKSKDLRYKNANYFGSIQLNYLFN